MSAGSRAALLRAQPDLWTVIEPLIDQARLEAVELVVTVQPSLHEIEAKYRKGEAEHGRDWPSMTEDDFATAIAEEIVDLIAYCAMREALYPTRPAFLSNRDLGDEQDAR